MTAKRKSAKKSRLLDVILIVLIIAAAGYYVGTMKRTPKDNSAVKYKKAKADILKFSKALEVFKKDVGRYPSSREGLLALMVAPTERSQGWNGAYILEVPPDPWGNLYVFRSPGYRRDYDIISFGPDGLQNGENFQGDIVNWQNEREK